MRTLAEGDQTKQVIPVLHFIAHEVYMAHRINSRSDSSYWTESFHLMNPQVAATCSLCATMLSRLSEIGSKLAYVKGIEQEILRFKRATELNCHRHLLSRAKTSGNIFHGHTLKMEIDS